MKIQILMVDPVETEVDALIRTVGDDLEPCTLVDRRIGVAAGHALLERLQGFGVVPVGAALVTPGGRLPASFLIHLVIRSADEPISAPGIRRAFLNALRQAAAWEMRAIAVPPLGTGAGNLDVEEAARIMLDVLEEHRVASPLPEEVTIVVGPGYEEETFTRAVTRPSSNVLSSDADEG